MSIQELRDLVLFGIKNDASFKSLVESKLRPKNESADEIYKFYKAQIQKLFKLYKKQGFINYSASNKIGSHVLEYSDKANMFFQDHLLGQSFAICKAIIDTMIKPLYYTDTSSGIFYQGLDNALQTAADIASSKKLKPRLRKEIYTYFLKLFKNQNNHGWGYEVDFLNILIHTSENNKEKEQLEKLIFEGGIDKYVMQLYSLIKKFHGNEAARDFVIEHKTLPEFREILYNELIEKRDYEAAKACMYEGIEVNKEYSGLVIKWVRNLLEIAEQTNDRDLKIRMSKTLFVNLGFREFQENIDYYEILKSEFTKDEWETELPQIMEHISDKNTLQEIYFRENLLDPLYKSIASKTNDYYFGGNHLNFNSTYIEALMPTYTTEIQKLLQDRIVEYIDIYKGKSYYKEVCTTLIMFKKMGMDISSIISYLKENYNRRPSLQARLDEYFA
ncbi:hypothetical protein [Jejuia pallidilutea]|nr:hypothetical protein [Jejuia pallidilutea]GAL72021.1 hypothetical protein JCM19302_366 [Jejuia pallidilutea]